MKSGVCLRSESGNPACAILEGGAPILRCDGVAATTHIEGIAFRGATQAIVCVNQSRPRFVDCDFVDNSASEGAAVFLEYSYPEFQRCRFTGNSASWSGACVFYQGNGDADLTGPLNFHDCEFTQNTAAGPAVLGAGWWRGPSVSFTDCLFAENVSTAGNLVATSTADIGHRSARFSYCSFLANSASEGLIETFGYDPHVEWCTAYGNVGSHFIVVNSIPPLGMSSGNITNRLVGMCSRVPASAITARRGRRDCPGPGRARRRRQWKAPRAPKLTRMSISRPRPRTPACAAKSSCRAPFGSRSMSRRGTKALCSSGTGSSRTSPRPSPGAVSRASPGESTPKTEASLA